MNSLLTIMMLFCNVKNIRLFIGVIIKKKLRAKHPELAIVMIFLESFTSGIPCMESKASTA